MVRYKTFGECVLTHNVLTAGQIPAVTISPVLIEGQVGETVTFTCDIGIENEGGSIGLDIFSPINNHFVVFQNESGRLGRASGLRDATFTFGPLMANDNGTQFLCRGVPGQNASQVATISVICK